MTESSRVDATDSTKPWVIVLLGVSGTGKTTIGELLSSHTNAEFQDGDDFHTEAAKSKMHHGEPLNDDDRLPWLAKIAAVIHEARKSNKRLIIACSGLKEKYRKVLLGDLPHSAAANTRTTSPPPNDVCEKPLSIIHMYLLDGERKTLEDRLKQRKGHYFDPKLLNSQLETLERPSEEELKSTVTIVKIEQDKQDIVKQIAEDMEKRLSNQSQTRSSDSNTILDNTV